MICIVYGWRVARSAMARPFDATLFRAEQEQQA
jgi:hypothetical protein